MTVPQQEESSPPSSTASSSDSSSSVCVVPEVALRWLILHGITSNVDLARLSNVNRSWRDVVTTVILEQATFKATSSGPLLLLPSMAAQLIRKNATTPTTVLDGSSTSATSTSTGAGVKTPDNNNSKSSSRRQKQSPKNKEETFCAAWFAPEGIQLLDLDAEQEDSDEDDSSEDYRGNPSNGKHKSQQQHHKGTHHHRHGRQSAAAGGGGAMAGSNAQKKKKNAHHHTTTSGGTGGGGGGGTSGGGTTGRSKSPMMQMMSLQARRAPRLEQIPQVQVWGRGHNGPTAKVSFEDQGILVSHEWRGYRHAMEILFPFGYSEFFVQHVLQRAQVHDQMRRIQQPSSPSSQSQEEEEEREGGGGGNNNSNNNNPKALMMDVSDRIDDINQRTSSHLEDEDEPVVDATQTTIAVRGATIARPEGYCLCWEHPTKKSNSSTTPVVQWTRRSSSSSDKNNKQEQQNNNNNNNNNDEEMVQTIKWQERQRKLKQWKEWRRQLQLTVLPQVLVRKPPHSNAVVQFLNSDEKHAVRFLTPKFQCGPIGEPVTIFVVGIATEDGCFCSGLHHRFELGHLYPNNALMELAEMSPICLATDAWECSPKTTTAVAAAATTTTTRRTPLEEHLDSDDDSEDDSDDDDDYSNDDDSSSDLVGDSSHRVPPHKKRGWLHNCACTFHDNSNPCGFGTTTDNNNEDENKDNDNSDAMNGSTMLTERDDSQTLRVDDDDDESADDAGSGGNNDDGDHHADDAERITRGARIPGMWHCYTAVFNGKQSVLRVDGVPEVLTTTRNPNKKAAAASAGGGATTTTTTTTTNTSEASGATNNNKGEPSPRNSSSGRRRGPRAMLDGLTIGSDHCFDMTLCFGQGSGGEGEGAIAEIAVFGGCLDTTDLEVIEKQLMIKHGIPIPELTREALVQEDEWTRKAHALYCQIPPEAAAARLRHGGGGTTPLSFDNGSIPLRIMAKHRAVAWHQFNAVTGEELRIKRIGSRSAGSSSDW